MRKLKLDVRQTKYLCLIAAIIYLLFMTKEFQYEEKGVYENRTIGRSEINQDNLEIKLHERLDDENSRTGSTTYHPTETVLIGNTEIPPESIALKMPKLLQRNKTKIEDEKVFKESSLSLKGSNDISVEDFMFEMSFLMDARWRGVANYRGKKISFNFWFFKNRYSFKGLSVELISWLIHERKIIKKLDFLTTNDESPSFLNLGMQKRIQLSTDKNTFSLYGESCPLFIGAEKSQLKFSVKSTQRILMELYCFKNGKWMNLTSVILDAK